MSTDSKIRVRFCPSPTGDPHVGMIRTALFNWAFARKNKGTFVFRIEDTDAARDSEDSYQALLAAMRWLNLDWDEGPEVGGPYGPYRQSERKAIYQDVAEKLLANKFAYHCYCSQDETAERSKALQAQGKTSGYDGFCRELTPTQISEFKAQGREPVVRFRMPDKEITFNDLIRGEITFKAEHVPDYVIVRANSDALYPLVNPVDDALMGITHVLRGEDLLSSTPRQIALYEAFAEIGIGSGVTPEFGHLPYVMGEKNKKLSKRDPESSLSLYQKQGFLPEGLMNYLGLLGWSFGDDKEFFSMKQMAENFDLARVSANPARFDIKKCTAVNADWIRALSIDELTQRLTPFLLAADLEITAEKQQLIKKAVPLVQERMETLVQAVGMLRFLLVDESKFEIEPADLAQVQSEEGQAVLRRVAQELKVINNWDTQNLHDKLNEVLVQELGIKPRLAFTPVRVAITGRRVSPPLFESMELLGQESCLRRIDQALMV
jgi:glutamyl-tRNA synthetase